MYSEYAIQVDNVSKTYTIYSKPIDRLLQYVKPGQAQNYKKFTALKPLSIRIKKGTTVGIVGRNGSGKSTLLQMIAGTLTPTTGHIQVQGRVAALLELGAGFNPEFTGRENVYLNASILGIPPEDIAKRFHEIVQFSEIGDFIDRPVKTYSSGMFVRLAFSVATLTDPEVVIIDEALSVGDEKFQRKCYNHLEQLKKRGCTVLFVSHSMKSVEQLCDYAYLLDHGTLLGEGEPKKIIDQYHLLLYAQENEHMKSVNEQAASIEEPEDAPEESVKDESEIDDLPSDATKIRKITMQNGAGEECFVFRSGDRSKIVVEVYSGTSQEDIAVGLRIKTTQGVEVYGTSTTYRGMDVRFERKRPCTIYFEQDLNLIAGTYHISVAIAKRVGSNDMIYLDKLSDHLLFKVEEIPLTGTGIANLNTQITMREG